MMQGKGSIWKGRMSCSGQEANLKDCPFRPLENNCTHDEDTWVECEDPFELRLVEGDNPCSGRLEVLHKGTWGSVCNDGWGEKEDQVVCKQLGCGKSLFPSIKAQRSYRPGTGRIWLDDVKCSGKEQSLEFCQHRLWGYHDCTHKEDVAVLCSGKSYCQGTKEEKGRCDLLVMVTAPGLQSHSCHHLLCASLQGWDPGS